MCEILGLNLYTTGQFVIRPISSFWTQSRPVKFQSEAVIINNNYNYWMTSLDLFSQLTEVPLQ
jgi:hypothetical protein